MHVMSAILWSSSHFLISPGKYIYLGYSWCKRVWFGWFRILRLFRVILLFRSKINVVARPGLKPWALGITSKVLNLFHRLLKKSGVILQTFPHCRPFPRKICNGAEKNIADLPPLQIFPRYHFNRYRFYPNIVLLLFVNLWKNWIHNCML